MKALVILKSAGIIALFLVSPKFSFAESDHEKHHPKGPAQGPSGPLAPAGGMGGMGEMMKEMMGPKKKAFYPSLMTLPKLSDEARSDLQENAHARMKAGASTMNRSLMDLTHAVESNDFAAMKNASANVRQGLAEFESGIATHEALAHGATPQQVGLSWFKRNLGLRDEAELTEEDGSVFGQSYFHVFIMSLLTIFSSAMIAMYFFKMRRAVNVLARAQAAGGTPLMAGAVGAAIASAAPANRPWKGKLKVATIYEETPTVKTFRLVPPDGGELPFTYIAGQFMTLAVVIDGKPIKRAYSISSHPCDKKALEITIKREENGLVSRYLHDVIHEGDLIDLEAAYGKLTFSGVGGGSIALIGGGVGITPLMSVLRCLIACGMKNQIHLLYACKSLEELVFREELRQLKERNPNLKILVAVDKLEGSFPGAFEGRLTKEKIQESVPDIASARIHLCGPPGMMQAVRAALIELKVPEEQIKTEAFGPAKAVPPKAPPAVATAPISSLAVAPASVATRMVTFKKAAKTLKIGADETVLELAESSGVDIPYSCRVGTCGTCKVKLLSGQVTMDVQDSLTDEDKKAGIVLACQAKAQSSLEIEEP